MNPIDKLGLMATLVDRSIQCELNHGNDGSTPEDLVAVNYLFQEMSDGSVMVIPICQDCSEALEDDIWQLLCCMRCFRNSWSIKELARHQMKDKVTWTIHCPWCITEEELNK